MLVVMHIFDTSGWGSPLFWKLAEGIVEEGLKSRVGEGRYRLDVDELATLMDIASQRYVYNDTIWESISSDFQINVEKGLCANSHIYTMVNALTRKSLPNGPGIVSQLVDYLVHKGYDSDDLSTMGKRKSVNFISNLATLCPGLQNELFKIHMKAFFTE